MLCLAAMLILLLMAWTLFDALWVTRDKIEVQASADVGAFSQAAVKSRSMNMMAFTNVGKRSIVGVYAVYESMFRAYLKWTYDRVMECIEERPECNYPVAQANWDLFYREYENDYEAYLDNRPYYVADVRALDNYQNYIFALTPWWGWSEAVTRAQRNGATLVTSYPFPRGTIKTSIPDLTSAVVNGAGSGAGITYSTTPDELPIRRGTFVETMKLKGMQDNALWRNGEHKNNVATHRSRSILGAASSEVINIGGSLEQGMTVGFSAVAMAMGIPGTDGSYAAAWDLKDYDEEADWLFDTSNIVVSFRQDAEYFEGRRDKYKAPPDDYEHDESSPEGKVYRPRGFWGMARSEISFQGTGELNLWEPAWTARMRPVSLPGEFADGAYEFRSLYHSSFTRLMLSGIMHGNITGTGAEYLDDLIYFEKAARGMGQSTIEGVGR